MYEHDATYQRDYTILYEPNRADITLLRILHALKAYRGIYTFGMRGIRENQAVNIESQEFSDSQKLRSKGLLLLRVGCGRLIWQPDSSQAD